MYKKRGGRLAASCDACTKTGEKANMARMNDPREAAYRGAEGEGKNSQAKGSDQDGTSESARQRRCTPKGQPVQDRESLRFGRFFHKALPFFAEEELCQARQSPRGILCVFPRAITQHGAIVPGKEGMVLWKKRLRRRQKDQRGLSASLFAQKQRYCASPSGGIPASRCRWQRKRGRDFRSRAIGGPLRSRPGNGNCGKVDKRELAAFFASPQGGGWHSASHAALGLRG